MQLPRLVSCPPALPLLFHLSLSAPLTVQSSDSPCEPNGGREKPKGRRRQGLLSDVRREIHQTRNPGRAKKCMLCKLSEQSVAQSAKCRGTHRKESGNGS